MTLEAQPLKGAGPSASSSSPTSPPPPCARGRGFRWAGPPEPTGNRERPATPAPRERGLSYQAHLDLPCRRGRPEVGESPVRILKSPRTVIGVAGESDREPGVKPSGSAGEAPRAAGDSSKVRSDNKVGFKAGAFFGEEETGLKVPRTRDKEAHLSPRAVAKKSGGKSSAHWS